LINALTGPVTTLLIMTGRQGKAAVGIVAGAALNVTAAAFLIPMLGLAGAALAATASLALSNVGLVWYSVQRMGIDPTALALLNRRPSGQSASDAG
jgi:O-antigen/teichoic acid export membrane protein